ncbi:MAG: ABC transporter substrate-binding protein [Pseudomonadota bacterium]
MMRRPDIDRRALLATGAAAALLAATGVTAQSMPERRGRLRMALSGATRNDSFNAQNGRGLFMQVAMVGCVFDTLTKIAADGTLRAELATGWIGDSEARTWTFKLREDVRFHNDMPFTADDVIASFALHHDSILSDLEHCATLDRHRLRVTLHASDPDFPYRLTDPRLVIYPAGALHEAMAQGIGTGLYRTERYQPGRSFLGTRVAQHYKDGQAGWFESVELVGLSSDSVRAEALLEDYVDAADLTHTADLGDLTGLTLLPEEHFMTSAVDRGIALPAQIGSRWPLDNLRAPERWWMA